MPADAGKKAFIVNRIGDFGFILAVFLIFWTFRASIFINVFHQAKATAKPWAPWVKWTSDRHLHFAVYWGDGQVGPDAALRLAA